MPVDSFAPEGGQPSSQALGALEPQQPITVPAQAPVDSALQPPRAPTLPFGSTVNALDYGANDNIVSRFAECWVDCNRFVAKAESRRPSTIMRCVTSHGNPLISGSEAGM